MILNIISPIMNTTNINKMTPFEAVDLSENCCPTIILLFDTSTQEGTKRRTKCREGQRRGPTEEGDQVQRGTKCRGY